MTNDNYKLIVTKYEKLIFTICFQMVRNYHEAENLTQETFISAFKHIDKCKPEEIKPWLCKIATNKAKDYLKNAYTLKVDLKEEYDSNLISSELSPEQIYISKEEEKKIKDKINSLKEPYLKVSIMYFIEEKNVDEISTILSRPKKTVQTQLLRAKVLLQNILKEGYVNGGTF